MPTFADLFPRRVNCQRAVLLPVPADQAWEVVGDIGSDIMTAGMVDRVETSGSGGGALRSYHLPGGAVSVEWMEDYDPDARSYVYRIVDAGPLPMTRHLGLAQVTPAGPDQCALSWSAMADPLGGSADELRLMLEANLAHAVTAVADHFRKQSAP